MNKIKDGITDKIKGIFGGGGRKSGTDYEDYQAEKEATVQKAKVEVIDKVARWETLDSECNKEPILEKYPPVSSVSRYLKFQALLSYP